MKAQFQCKMLARNCVFIQSEESSSIYLISTKLIAFSFFFLFNSGYIIYWCSTERKNCTWFLLPKIFIARKSELYDLLNERFFKLFRLLNDERTDGDEMSCRSYFNEAYIINFFQKKIRFFFFRKQRAIYDPLTRRIFFSFTL